jgi:predicted DNA-binding transcriptional regulator AlpA
MGDLLTELAVARQLGVQKRTLAGWRRAGSGPPWVRLTAMDVRYRQEDVDAWVAARVQTTWASPRRKR